MKRYTLKPRAIQGELRNLMGHARDRLHSWFREQEGTVPYQEIRRRLKTEFGLNVSISSLSRYYSDHFLAINPATEDGSPARTIVIQIEVPAGCRIAVSTETEGAAERE